MNLKKARKEYNFFSGLSIASAIKNSMPLEYVEKMGTKGVLCRKFLRKGTIRYTGPSITVQSFPSSSPARQFLSFAPRSRGTETSSFSIRSLRK